MVCTLVPSACSASMVQDLAEMPSTCTTQAPHWLVSQPTWVPVSRRFSRRNCTNRVRGSTLAVTGLPFTIKETLAISTLYLVRVAADDLRTRISAAQASKSTGTHNMGPSGIEQPRPGMAGYDVWLT